jgi:hypothetical protein
MAEITKSKFGVPIQDGSAGMLMPKLKYRFRVNFIGIGNEVRPISLTQNIQSVTRPKVSYEEVIVDSYNSKMYLHGKHSWEVINVVIRDDITNGVAKLVGAQVQRQVNHFQQTTPAAANDYKFEMEIEVLDGASTAPTEVWFLEGCFLQNVDYMDSDYTANEVQQISLTVRFDNATHYSGTNDGNGRSTAINPFQDIISAAAGSSVGI